MRILFLIAFVLAFAAPARAQDNAKSGFDRVTQTQHLRCAYTSLPPFISVDPATHSVSGMLYDIANEIGRRLNLKVDWVEDVGYGDIAAGMNAGRYDAWCGVLWQTPSRAGAMSFSTPLYKNKVYPCVRRDSTAYDKSAQALNAADITLGGYDGDVSLQIAKNIFPKAKTMAFPANTSWAEIMQSVAQKKIDAVATCSPNILNDFNAHNKGSELKLADPAHPITSTQVAIALPLGDTRLKNMTDTAIYDMQADGTMDAVIKQYLAPYIDNTIVLIKPY